MIGQASFVPRIVSQGQMAAGPLPPVMPPGDLAGKMEDMHGKIRKPYTITKQRENWTEQEHTKFLKALELFDRDWRKIEEYVGTKTVIQIRSHAQKYFLKVQKLGQDAHVPPPRPKRKSSQPYPQKASKVVAAVQAAQQAAAASTKGFSPREGAYTPGGAHPAIPPQSPQEEAGTMAAPAWGAEAPSKANPDFAKVYRFLGNVFEIGVAGNLQKLKGMPPIDRETIILLMRNLAINLASPVFAEQQHILALADSSARSQQLGEQAQPRIEQEPQSAPPTPSDTSVTPGSNGELGAGSGAFLESPGYRDDLRQQQSPLYEEDARGGVKARGFNEGAPLGLGLGLGMAPVLQRDVLKERGGSIDSLAT